MEYDGGLLAYLESEGIIPTRQGRIEKVIRIFAAEGGIEDENFNHQEEVLVAHDLEDLSPQEAEYICKEVNKRLWR